MDASEWAAKWNSLSASGRLWMEFWEDYQQRYPNDVAESNLASGFAGANTYHRIPEANLQISLGLIPSRSGVVVFIPNWMPGTESSQSLRARAAAYRAVLQETLIDTGLPWNGWLTIDVYDQTNWLEIAGWLHESLVVRRRIIRRHALEAEVAND